MSDFWWFCGYLFLSFLFGLFVQHVIYYYYPPMCNECIKKGTAQTIWQNIQSESDKNKPNVQQEADQAEEDL